MHIFFRYLRLFLWSPFLIPHICLYITKKRVLNSDISVAYNYREWDRKADVLSFLHLIITDKWFRTIFYYRIGKMSRFILYPPPCPDFIIDRRCVIGKGLLGIHPFSTIINALSIGNNFIVRNNITIGSDNEGGRPIIGDNVVIYVNSCVFGKIKIGNNVVIGAGTVLKKSVPDNCVVIGNPARIIKKDGKKVKITL